MTALIITGALTVWTLACIIIGTFIGKRRAMKLVERTLDKVVPTTSLSQAVKDTIE